MGWEAEERRGGVGARRIRERRYKKGGVGRSGIVVGAEERRMQEEIRVSIYFLNT